MTYTPLTWNDADPATPATAARVNHMQDGIEDADTRITACEANLGVYPLAGYGFHSATFAPESAQTTSTIGGWHARIWVPPNQSITRVGMAVTSAGTLGAGGLNGFAIYSDDGATKLGESANADSFWTATGLRTVAMASNIAAITTGRFVRVLVNVTGYSAAPSVSYAFALESVASGTRRSAFFSALSSWPTSFTPDSYGTSTNFLPLIMLG